VFILCTGRSGSSALIKACKHIDNYTSDHESLSRSFGSERFNYKDNHIEADNRLSWHLGQLNKLFGDTAFYVHLKRGRNEVALSFLNRFYTPESIVDSFCEGIRMTAPEKLSKEEQLEVCYDYIDTVHSNIEHFLIDKTNVMTISLENICDDFKLFWYKIGATGNLEQALKEFEVRHNNSVRRPLNLWYRFKLMVVREWRHIQMCIKPL